MCVGGCMCVCVCGCVYVCGCIDVLIQNGLFIVQLSYKYVPAYSSSDSSSSSSSIHYDTE